MYTLREVARMPEDESRTNWMPGHFSLPQQSPGKQRADLQGEDSIRELISLGAPLPVVLNKLCSAIDLQIGNVVSVILLADDQEHDLQTIARSALHYGLHIFWSASITLSDENLLGSFEMYCCVSRAPTAYEVQLIQRVTYLAALAIRRHQGEEDFESLSSDWKTALQRHSHDGPLAN